jgi:hypothetical protein
MPGKQRSSVADVEPAPRAMTCRRGRLVTGAAGPSPRLCAAAPGAGCPPPGPRPRSGPRGCPAATNARARGRANGQRPRAPGRRGKPRLDRARLKPRHLRGSGRRTLPEPPPGIVDVSRNLSRALRVAARWATPTLDRTRTPRGSGLQIQRDTHGDTEKKDFFCCRESQVGRQGCRSSNVGDQQPKEPPVGESDERRHDGADCG